MFLQTVLILSSFALAVGPRTVPLYEGSKTEKLARASGTKLLRELTLDIDGDGKDEIAIVEALAGGTMRVVVLRPTGAAGEKERSFEVVAETSPQLAKKLLRFEAKRILGRKSFDLLAVFEDPSPDETAEHMRILAATGRGIREIFSQTFYLPNESPKDPSVVELGNATPQYALLDPADEKRAHESLLPKAGDRAAGSRPLDVVWVKEPQKLTLAGAKGPVTFVIGAYRTIYRWDPAKERFAVLEESNVVDFLEPRPPSEVIASSQVGKVWGTAQPFWATDGDLDTAWNVPLPKGPKDAVGQSITAKFKEPFDLKMIRIVPGCAHDAAAWNDHYRVKAFRLLLSSGQRLEIDRKKLQAPPAGVRALGEFPLEGGVGAQVLVFLSEPQNVRWVKLEIMDLEPMQGPKGRRVNEACVSEISFH